MGKNFNINNVLEEAEIEEMDELFEDSDDNEIEISEENEAKIMKDFDQILDEIED